MRIGIDCTATGRRQTGLEAYTLSLVGAMLRSNSSIEFVLFLPTSIPEQLVLLRDRFSSFESPFGNRLFANQLWLASMARVGGVDLMHYPALPPVFPPHNFVMTLHDATPWKFPQTMSKKGYIYFRSTLSLWLRKSNMIITPSVACRDEIVGRFGFATSKVRVIHHGVRSELVAHAASKGSHLLERLGLAPGYVLYVGTVEPRKNLAIVLQALARLRARGIQVRFLIVGRLAWGRAQLTRVLQEEKVEDLVVFTGHVPDYDLACLYENAAFLVQPSLYEGFGLPIVEAMALGCPVIASRISAHVEVLGDAGLFFSPFDVDGLADMMVRLLADDRARASMAERGSKRSQDFSWERAASRTLEVYNEVLTKAMS